MIIRSIILSLLCITFCHTSVSIQSSTSSSTIEKEIAISFSNIQKQKDRITKQIKALEYKKKVFIGIDISAILLFGALGKAAWNSLKEHVTFTDKVFLASALVYLPLFCSFIELKNSYNISYNLEIEELQDKLQVLEAGHLE